MKIFFLSVASGTQKKTAEALNYPYILINFMTKANTPPKTARVLFVDSGGFPSSFLYNGYNKSDEEYLNFVLKHDATYFALRDYPCEVQIIKKHDTTPENQILRTVEHHIKLLDLSEDYGLEGRAVPVLQGWETDEYLYCLDLFREHGLIRDYMAIGSLCRRHAEKQIRKIILTVRQELPDWVKLHAFGTKISVLRNKAVWDAIYSVDSGAWDFDARWKRYTQRIRAKSTFEASLKCAKEYISKINRLHANFSKQIKLGVECK